MNRPFDDKSQARVALEAEAVSAILGLLDSGDVEMVSSDILIWETNKNPHPQKRGFVQAILEHCPSTIGFVDSITSRADELEQIGFKRFDAMHLAFAETAEVDCFCTCDDQILKNAARQQAFSFRVCSTIDFVIEAMRDDN